MREPLVHTLRNPIKTKLAVIIYTQRTLCGPSGPVYAASLSVSSCVKKHHFKSIKILGMNGMSTFKIQLYHSSYG